MSQIYDYISKVSPKSDIKTIQIVGFLLKKNAKMQKIAQIFADIHIYLRWM